MPDDLQDAYQLALETGAVPVVPVTRDQDWHLRIFYLPSNLPESIFDLDFRDGRALFYGNRFERSVWLTVLSAKSARGTVQPFTTKRSCIELPPEHPLVGLIQDEHVFRLADQPCQQLDGDSYFVRLTHRSHVVEFEAWSLSLDARWQRMLDSLQAAIRLLPKGS